MFKKDLKIAVVGDLMLDRFVYGSVDRISPEAPIPIFKTNGQVIETLGGAGNVLNNLLSLGYKADIIGSVGDDEVGDEISAYLWSKKINGTYLNINSGKYKSGLKVRYIADGQHVVRIDSEEISPIEYPKKIDKFYDVTIISDYAKGNITKGILAKIIPRSEFIILDPHPDNKDIYSEFSVDLITPNNQEAVKLTNLQMGSLNSIIDISKKLRKYAQSSIITNGSDGMYVYEDKCMIRIPSEKVEVYDVSGAGDTVVAILAIALGSGLNLRESAKLANKAAGIVVGKIGTATVTMEELNGKS